MIVRHQSNRAAFAGNHRWYWPGQALLQSAWSATSVFNPATLNLRFKMGAVVLLASGNVAIPSSGSNVPWEIEGMFIVRTVAGISAALMATGKYNNGQTSGLLANAATVAVDPTAAADLQVSAQWGTASASNTITVQNLTIEKA